MECHTIAIAYLRSLCHAQKPDEFRMQQSEVRHHLLVCFENGQLSPFPATKKNNVQGMLCVYIYIDD